MRQLSLKVIVLLFGLSAKAQYDSIGFSGLKIGDKMPGITISNVQNYSKTDLKFSDLRGKHLILDFWATYCSGCILQFPKLEALQKKFGDRVQIILVNQQSKEEIEKGFASRKNIDPIYRNVIFRLPSITSDSILNRLFPHALIPHEIWIDTTGIIMAITDERSLTDKNIQNVLDGYFDMPTKKDLMTYRPYDPLLPQIMDSNNINLQYYSCLIRGVNGLRSPLLNNVDSAAGSFRVTRPTVPILMLYADVLSKGAGYANPYDDAYFDYGKRVVLEIKDSSRYFYDSSMRYDKWFEKNCYGYEMVIPVKQKDSSYAYMLNDLNRYFCVYARVERRKMRCLAIVRTSNNEKFKFLGTSTYQGPRHWPDSNNVFHFRSTSFKVFRKKLCDYNKSHPLPIVDDTRYGGLIQMDLQSPLNDIESLRRELRKKYDLDIIERVQLVEVMILTENGYKK